MAQAEGIRDLGFLVGQTFGANSADPRMKNLLHESLTLYSGIKQLSELTNRTVSHCQLGVLQPPGCEYSYYYHSPSCNADNPAIEQIGWFGLMTLIDSVRMFTGPEWQPTEIGVMTAHLPGRSIREAFPGVQIRTSQPYSWIALENTLLGLPPSPSEATTTPSSPPRYESFATDLVGSLEQALLSYLQEGELSIELAAALCNMSTRTLQRNLKEAGTRYSNVLDRARFRAASQLLGNSAMNVTDIGHQLGYSDVAHFTRAFRRIAGVTPLAYRQQFMD